MEAVTDSSPARRVAVMVALPGSSIDVTWPRTTLAAPALDVVHTTASVTSTPSRASAGDAATCSSARQLSPSSWPSQDTLSTGSDVVFADDSGCTLHAAMTMVTTSGKSRRDLNSKGKYSIDSHHPGRVRPCGGVRVTCAQTIGGDAPQRQCAVLLL